VENLSDNPAAELAAQEGEGQGFVGFVGPFVGFWRAFCSLLPDVARNGVKKGNMQNTLQKRP